MTDTSTKRIPTANERADLLRSFIAWTRNPTIADDLVQQTMIEAWKSDRQPEDREWRPWLFGIARNVFYRWRRELARDLQRTIAMPESDEVFWASVDDPKFDQREIVSFLSDMLDELPEDTRQVLLMKYIDNLPQAEVADRLGFGVKALESRLLRGKRKLRDHILIYRPDTAIELGLVTDTKTWHKTNIWCFTCGRERLEARWFEDGTLRYDCPACHNDWYLPGERTIQTSHHFLSGIPQSPPSFARLHEVISERSGLVLHHSGPEGTECPHCGRMIQPIHWSPPESYSGPIEPEIQLDVIYTCQHCTSVLKFAYLPGNGIWTKQGNAFTAKHPQVQMLKPVAAEWQSRPAIRTTWMSLNDPGEFTCWVDTETFTLLDIMIDGELQ
ncbi:MAG: RNA polymerase sigma factor [Thermomicrobiales bacterium]|nr:RNA polymerase sigma factor [Thermomicrobiales bacterium]